MTTLTDRELIDRSMTSSMFDSALDDTVFLGIAALIFATECPMVLAGDEWERTYALEAAASAANRAADQIMARPDEDRQYPDHWAWTGEPITRRYYQSNELYTKRDRWTGRRVLLFANEIDWDRANHGAAKPELMTHGERTIYDAREEYYGYLNTPDYDEDAYDASARRLRTFRAISAAGLVD